MSWSTKGFIYTFIFPLKQFNIVRKCLTCELLKCQETSELSFKILVLQKSLEFDIPCAKKGILSGL